MSLMLFLESTFASVYGLVSNDFLSVVVCYIFSVLLFHLRGNTPLLFALMNFRFSFYLIKTYRLSQCCC